MDTFPASLRRVLRTRGRLMYRAERRAEKKSKAGVAVFVPWSRRLPLLPLFPFNLDLQRVLSLIDRFLTLRIVWDKYFSLLYITLQTCFVFSFGGHMALHPRHIQYSPWFVAYVVSCFSINFYKVQNAKISAVRSLAVIFFLHVLIWLITCIILHCLFVFRYFWC